MIHSTTGDILKSESHAIVNTVNCEGFMGKGIAYQFKLTFPENFASYAEACKKNALTPGKLHTFQERKKLIINFPTKNKWREKSKYEYIEGGLKELKKVIKDLKIESISIPPLGCGNGGLDWNKVKEIIISELSDLKETEILLYEPSKNYSSKPTIEPSLSLSHYLTMQLKESLSKFSRFRLQKLAFLVDFFKEDNYFKFDAHHYGPYSHSLDIVSKQISEFQNYHNIKTPPAMLMLEKKLQSKSFFQTVDDFSPTIKKSAEIINATISDKDLELTTSILYIIHTTKRSTQDQIINTLKSWSERKSAIFSEQEISDQIESLIKNKVLKKDMFEHVCKA